jgi:hypothetical protein
MRGWIQDGGLRSRENRVSNWWLEERERLQKGGWRREDEWELNLMAGRKGFICWLIRKRNRCFWWLGGGGTGTPSGG